MGILNLKSWIGIFAFCLHFAANGQSYSLKFAPKAYACAKAQGSLLIDGELNEADWQKAPWTSLFVDIEGNKKPQPKLNTRAKMLWDDQYFYVAATMDAPHLWATYDQHDMVIFHENDFEVFIDPDGDTHHYYELEINALATVWDLLLTRPYRDQGIAVDEWDLRGLKKAVKCFGTINNPNDTDKKWQVELAIPLSALIEKPEMLPGQVWRVNFSRVDWKLATENGQYKKAINPTTGKAYPESNWVWSPQGVVNMHQPEKWGYVLFLPSHGQTAVLPKQYQNAEAHKWFLRKLYYAQQDYYKKHNQYARSAGLLGINVPKGQTLQVYVTPSHYEALLKTGRQTWHINQHGRVWETTP